MYLRKLFCCFSESDRTFFDFGVAFSYVAHTAGGDRRSGDEGLMRTRSRDAVSGEAAPKCDGIKSRQFTV